MRKLLFISLLFSTIGYGQGQITIDRFRQVHPIDGQRTKPHLLFDGSTTTENWFESSSVALNFVLPNETFVDLGAVYSQVKLEYHNWFATGEVQPTFTLFSNNFTDSLTLTNLTATPFNGYKWVDTVASKAAAFNPRWIKIRFTHLADTREIRIYGTLQTAAETPYVTGIAAPSDPGIYFQGVGVNGDEDTLYIKEAANVRISHTMWYHADNKAETYGSLSYKFYRYRDEAQLLGYLKRNNWKAGKYVNGAAAAARPHFLPASPTFTDFSKLNWVKDIPGGSDSTAVENWNLNAKPFWQATAYLFGNNPSATAPAGHALSATTIAAGRNLLNWSEITGNEDDKTWGGDTAYHRPQVTIVKAKAGYEGAKLADPNFQTYLGAMISFDTLRLKGIHFLSYRKYGKGNFPFDAIAFNQYISSARGGQPRGINTDSAISPEQFNLFEFTRKAVEFRNTYFPGKELIWTELGFATNTTSNYDVPLISGSTKARTKADWYIRSLEQASIKQTADSVAIDAVFSYWHQSGIDPTDDFSTMYNTSPNFDGGGAYLGTATHNEQFYWMTTRKTLLWNARAWSTLIQRGDSTGTWITRRYNLAGDTAFYCVWRGTRTGSTQTNLSLALPDAVGTTATMYQMVMSDEDGLSTALTITSGAVTVPTVSETPLYIKVPVNVSGGGPSLPTPGGSNILKTRFRKVVN